jgi:putative endonuclease
LCPNTEKPSFGVALLILTNLFLMFHTYVIQSTTSGVLYIGQTNNLHDRIHRHNTNRNKWTKNKGPWILIFSQAFESRAEAMALETKLKSFKNREYLLVWIEQQNNPTA